MYQLLLYLEFVYFKGRKERKERSCYTLFLMCFFNDIKKVES